MNRFLFLATIWIVLVLDVLTFTSGFLESRWHFCKGTCDSPMTISVCGLDRRHLSGLCYACSLHTGAPVDSSFLCLLASITCFPKWILGGHLCMNLHLPRTLICVSTLLINRYWVSQLIEWNRLLSLDPIPKEKYSISPNSLLARIMFSFDTIFWRSACLCEFSLSTVHHQGAAT